MTVLVMLSPVTYLTFSTAGGRRQDGGDETAAGAGAEGATMATGERFGLTRRQLVAGVGGLALAGSGVGRDAARHAGASAALPVATPLRGRQLLVAGNMDVRREASAAGVRIYDVARGSNPVATLALPPLYLLTPATSPGLAIAVTEEGDAAVIDAVRATVAPIRRPDGSFLSAYPRRQRAQWELAAPPSRWEVMDGFDGEERFIVDVESGRAIDLTEIVGDWHTYAGAEVETLAGDRLAVVYGGWPTSLVDLESGAVHTKLDGTGQGRFKGDVQRLVVSPDATRFVVGRGIGFRGERLELWGSDGAPVRDLLEDAGEIAAAWLPEGDRLVVWTRGDGGTSVFLLDVPVGDGEARRSDELAAFEATELFIPFVVDQGRRLLVAYGEDSSWRWRVIDLRDGTAATLPDASDLSWWSSLRIDSRSIVLGDGGGPGSAGKGGPPIRVANLVDPTRSIALPTRKGSDYSALDLDPLGRRYGIREDSERSFATRIVDVATGMIERLDDEWGLPSPAGDEILLLRRRSNGRSGSWETVLRDTDLKERARLEPTLVNAWVSTP